jgi:hypothetical protein
MRISHIPVAVLMATTALAADNNKPPKPPKPPPAPKVHPNAGGGAGAPKRSSDEQIEKLAGMTPAQREKALSGLPPERRAHLQAQLDHWNKLSPEQKAQQKALEEKYRSLPPATKKRIQELSNRIKALPNDRKIVVLQELQRLRNMPAPQREKRLNNPAVQKNFSPEEQDILRESPGILPQNYF